MLPSSFQPPIRGDVPGQSSVSQSIETNIAKGTATVAKLLEGKGAEVFSIRAQDTLAEAVEALRTRRIGALVVTDAEGALEGILSERDIVRRLAETPGRTLGQRVEEVMTRRVEVCQPEEALVSVLRRMTAGRFRHMPVMQGETLCGIVTIGDVVNYRLNELEHETLQLKQMIVG
ncbi:MAG: CBS domain-containing protein [Pseudomonadota bacterium]